MKSISLEISNTIKDCDKGYIEIRCVVNGQSITDVMILLARLNESVAYVSEDVVLVDTDLADRSGVVVSSLIRYVGSSYLSIRINGSVVKQLKDKGPYRCYFNGFDSDGGLISEFSTFEMLNRTGNLKFTFSVFNLSKQKQ